MSYSVGTWLALPAALVVAGLYRAPETTKNVLKVSFLASLFLAKPDIGCALQYTGYGALGVVSVTAGLLYLFQTKMVYPADFPAGSRKGTFSPKDRLKKPFLHLVLLAEVLDPFSTYGIPYDDLTLTTPDNVKIRAYLIYAKNRTDIESLKRSHNARRKSEEMADVDATQPLSEEQAQFAKSRPTVLLYHANAGNMGHRIPLGHIFWNNMGCNVMMLSYRGYGLSEGSPSEKGMRIDAQVSNQLVFVNMRVA